MTAFAAVFVGTSIVASGDLQPQERAYLEVGEDRIHYEVAGQGATVLFLHDGLTHAGIWDGLFRRYADAFRVVRYDRRGHGHSDVPAAPYSPVGDLQALLDHLEVDSAVLVGLSSGGRLALDYAAAHPARVSGLVLVGPVVSGYGYSEHFVERGRRNMAPLAEGDLEAAIENWVCDPHLVAAGGAEVRERIGDLLASHAGKRLLQFDPGLAVARGRPALHRLGDLAVPTLIVVGEKDIPDVHAHAGAIDSRLPDSRRVVVPGSGHLVPIDRPDLFHGLVLEFLQRR